MNFMEKLIPTNLVGLDIGTHAIKFAQLKETTQGWQLVKVGMADISAVSEGEGVDAELKDALIIETIKTLFKEHKINSRNVVTSVSGDAVIVRHVKLPVMTEVELNGVLRYEAEQYIPNVDQFALDFQVLGETVEENQKKIEVLLVGVKHELIEKHLKILDGAGLKSIMIDIDCLALSNIYEINYEDLKADPGVVLIHMGAKLTTINIMDGNSLKNTRDVFVGGHHFARDIQREFNLSYSQAQELKEQQASIIVASDDISLLRMPSKEDRSIQIFEAINPTLNKCITEIRRFFDYYETLSKKKTLHKIILSGGGAKIKNMEVYLREKLGLAVEWNDPFKNIDMPPAEREAMSKDAHLFAVALGLATRRARA